MQQTEALWRKVEKNTNQSNIVAKQLKNEH